MNNINRVLATFLVVILTASTTQAHSIASEGNKNYAESTWGVDLAAMRDVISQGLPVEVPLGGGLGMQPVLLTEFNNFVDGLKLRPVLDQGGQPIGYEEFPYWSYSGTVLNDPTSEVLLTMDDRGLYGHVRAFGALTWFNPQDEEHILTPGEEANVGVKWVDDGGANALLHEAQGVIDDVKNLDGLSVPAAYSTCTGDVCETSASAKGGCDSYTKGILQPIADKKFTDKHSNFATRVANALNAQVAMWKSYTCITFTYTAVVAPGYNYSTDTNCYDHLADFQRLRNSAPGVDAYQLFTGINISGSTIGCGYTNPTAGKLSAWPSSVVEAVDHSAWDVYDPDETTTDLGLVSGHEIGHNWGEPYHPSSKNKNGCYNIMATGVDTDNVCFWFTSTSSGYIKKATKGNL